MIRVTKSIKLTEGPTYWIAPFGDVHYNTDEADKERFQLFIEWLTAHIKRGNNVGLIGVGDYNDALSPSERASLVASKGGYGLHDTSLKTLDKTAKEMSDTFLNVVKPLKGHFLGLLDGHHYMTFSGMSPTGLRGRTNTEYMCDKLDCPYLGVGLGIIELDFGYGFKLVIAASHGYGGARTSGARVSKRVRMAEVVRADIYLMGHDDEKMAKESQVLDFIDGKYVSREQVFIGTGSFQRGYPSGESGGYVEQLLLPPCGLGTVLIGVELEKRKGRYHLHHFWRSWR